MASLGTFSGGGLGFGIAFTLYDDFTKTSQSIQTEMGRLAQATDRLAARVNNRLKKSMTLPGLTMGGKPIKDAIREHGSVLSAFYNDVGAGPRSLNIFSKTLNQGRQAGPRAARIIDPNVDAKRALGDVNREASRMTYTLAAVTATVGGFIGKAVEADMAFERYQLGIEIFVGSSAKAAAVIEDIKKAALANPVFEADAMIRATSALISQGVASEKAVTTIKDLSAILAGLGRGDAELSRIGLDLQKIAATGKLTGVDLRQMARAGIPIRRLLGEYFHKELPDTLKGVKITIDDVAAAFAQAVGPAGQFRDALAKASSGARAQWMMLKENTTFTLAAIGKALRPITMAVLQFANAIMTLARTAAGSPIGMFFIRLLAVIAALTVVVLALLTAKVLLKAAMFNVADAINIETLAAVGAAWAEGGFAAATEVLTSAIWGLLASMWPLLLAVGLIAAAYVVVNKSLDAFDSLVRGDSEVARGYVGWLQKIGGWIRFIGQLFSGWDAEKGRFLIDKDTFDAMDKLGLGNSAINFAMTLGRILVLVEGIGDGFSEMWQTLSYMLQPSVDLFDEQGNAIDQTKGKLIDWRETGKEVGRALAFSLMAIVKVLLLVLDMVILVTKAFGPLAKVWNTLKPWYDIWKWMNPLYWMSGVPEAKAYGQLSTGWRGLTGTTPAQPAGADYEDARLRDQQRLYAPMTIPPVPFNPTSPITSADLYGMRPAAPATPNVTVTAPIYIDSNLVAQAIIDTLHRQAAYNNG